MNDDNRDSITAEDDVAPWPPHSTHHLTELYNREYNKVNCEQGWSDEDAHRDACKALYKAGHPPPIMLKPTASGQTTGMSRDQIVNRLGTETVRRAIYEGALRRVFDAVGAVGFDSEDGPTQAALTEAYNICNAAIPGINGEEPEPGMDATILVLQEEYRKLAHDAPHDDLGADLIYWTERHREIAKDAERRCEEAIKRREEAYRERDIALRRASRLERELEEARGESDNMESGVGVLADHINEIEGCLMASIQACNDGMCSATAAALQDALGLAQRGRTAKTPPPRIAMLERALDHVSKLLRKLERDLGDKLGAFDSHTLFSAVESCYHNTPEFEERFGQRLPAPSDDEEEEEEDETGELTNRRGGL